MGTRINTFLIYLKLQSRLKNKAKFSTQTISRKLIKFTHQTAQNIGFSVMFFANAKY